MVEMNSIQKALKEYMDSIEFQEDCDSIRSGYILKEDSLPTDMEIERLAVEEKEKELIIEKECMEKGHDLADEEEIGGRIWVYCKRCGDWIEKIKKDE